ncbi:metallophosphoesterase family protein [Ferruginibacter sp.]
MQRRKFLQNLSVLSAAASLPAAAQATIEKKKSKFSFVFMSDMHIKPLPAAEAGFAKALQNINQLKPQPDLIINGGDCIMDALAADKEKTKTQWDLYNKILQAENKLPLRYCLGNHDIWAWQLKDADKADALYGKNWWLQQTGYAKTYYSFTHHTWHFIVLDSVQENNGGYIALLDADQFTWLETELENNKDKFVCIVSHIPVMAFCSAMFFKDMLPNGDWKLSRALLHTDARKIKDLFKKYPNIKTCLSGHIHLQDAVEYLGIQYFCNGAISGDWWSGPFQDFAPAYALFTFHSDGAVERMIVNY